MLKISAVEPHIHTRFLKIGSESCSKFVIQMRMADKDANCRSALVAHEITSARRFAS